MRQEASFTFTTPLNVNIVNIKGVEQTFVEGDISTNDIDFVNDIMSKKCQESMQKQILERNMKLDIEHEAFKGNTSEEKEIAKTKIPAGKLVDAVVKELSKLRWSTRVKGQINRNREDYKTIQGNLTEGYLDAFSVAFLPTEVKYETIEGKSITISEYKNLPHEERRRILDDCILLNVALTGNPCNTKAQVASVVSKSMDALEDYQKRKELDPSIEDALIVKALSKQEKEKLDDVIKYMERKLGRKLTQKEANIMIKDGKDLKTQALYHVTSKLYRYEKLNPKELKLLKAALEVAENTGAQKELAKEIFEKVSSGDKLNYKEIMLLDSLIYVEQNSETMATELRNKSQSIGSKTPGDNSKLNIQKNSNKMTEDNPNTDADEGTDAGNGNGSESGDGEGEQTKMLKSVSENLKTLSDKYVGLKEENATIKEDMKEISENLLKVVKALEQPVHKSPGVEKTDAEKEAALKASAEGKSVDPLGLCN